MTEKEIRKLLISHCFDRGKPSQIAREIGVSVSTVTRWKMGGAIPVSRQLALRHILGDCEKQAKIDAAVQILTK